MSSSRAAGRLFAVQDDDGYFRDQPVAARLKQRSGKNERMFGRIIGVENRDEDG